MVASAEAVIKIETATVQNGVAFIKGNGAEKGLVPRLATRVRRLNKLRRDRQNPSRSRAYPA
jgi:hypothetical protein